MRPILAAVLLVIVLGGGFVYGAVATITSEDWPDW